MGQSTMKKGIIFTLLGATCWGLSGVLGEYLLNISKIDPVWIIANRLFFSGITMVAILLIKDKKNLVRVFSNKIDILKLLNFSFFGLLICQGTFFLTIKYTNAGMATVIQYIGPVIIMLYYCVIGRRWPLPREVIAIVVSLFGTVLIATHFDFSKLNISTLGLFWGLLSAFGLASYNIFSISLTTKYGVMPIMAWGLLFSGIVVYFLTGSYYIPNNFKLIDLICMSGVVLIGTIMSFSLYLEGVRLIGAVTGSITCSKNSDLSKISQYPIEVPVGAEIVTGSTRMKAGTAQKMILNMISTTLMIKLGKVFSGYMVDVKTSNQKLVERAKRIIMKTTGADYEIASSVLEKAGNDVKTAIAVILLDIDRDMATEKLKQYDNNVAKLIHEYSEKNI